MTEKFRVGVVTILEVEAVDWTDATHVAEGAVKHALRSVDAGDVKPGPIIVKWQHVNDHDYEATVVRSPAELGVAARNGYMYLEVQQPAKEEE